MAYTLIGSDSMVAGGANTNLQSHTPSGANALASNWVHLTWQSAASAVVENADNTLCQPYHSGVVNWNPYVIGPTAAAVQKVDFTYGTANDSLSGLILLAANDTTNWRGYLAFHNTVAAGRYDIYKVASGALTLLANAQNDTTNPAVGDVLSFEVDASGNLTVRLNGVSRATVLDTTYTSGQPGVAVKKSRTTGGINAFNAYQDTGGAGGSTFNESASDALSLGDSIANTAKFLATGSDSLALAASAANTAKLLASGSDSLALSASATGLRTTFGNVSDSLSLTSAIASQATLRPSAADALGLADSVAAQGGAPVSSPTGPTPAGSSRHHKRRAYVEIDGQRFEVDGPEHARALLDRARDVAARHAQELAAQAVVKKRRGKRPIALATPRIESPHPELAPVITQARKAINKLYRDTAIDAELAALMAEHLAREDEDEEILLLM